MAKLNNNLKKFSTVDLIKEVSARAKAERSVLIDGASKVYEYLIDYCLKQEEYFILLILNNKGRVKKKIEISKGTINQCLVHPREVFYYAIKYQAASIIVAHNHPGGDPKPSYEDDSITRRLKEVSTITGINLLDHVIVGKEGYYSYSENSHIL